MHTTLHSQLQASQPNIKTATHTSPQIVQSQYTFTLSFTQLQHTQHSIHFNGTFEIEEINKE